MKDPISNSRPTIFSLLAFALLLAACSSNLATERQYVPAQNLMDVVKDFQRFAREDVYRFPIAKDVTGVNVMKAALVRLDDYERKNPRQFIDIIQFSRATAYERLRDYDKALDYYHRVADIDGPLRPQALKNIETLETFKAILDKPLPTEDPFIYLKALDERVESWNGLVKKYQGSPQEYLARVEEEKIDRAKVAFVEANRFRLTDGNHITILAYSQLVTKHRQSKNYYRYLLDFGDFYVRLAKDYIAENDPEGLAFDMKIYGQLEKQGLNLYTEVAGVDGIVEKIEAQGKIEALRGLSDKVRRLSR
ncbi:MAG TPA: tetratricopeptide repeat protein [Candidatus Binatia bacterium]